MSNQPLSAHPIPGFFAAHTLGLLPALEADINNEDRLIIPAPAADPNGSVARVLQAGTFFGQVENDGGGPLAPGDVQLVFKTSNGREVLLAQNGGGEVTGGLFPLAVDPAIVIPSNSLGVYLRVTATPTVKVYAFVRDVRAEVIARDISGTSFTEIGIALKRGETGTGVIDNPDDGEAVGAVVNFDSVNHDFLFRITNPAGDSFTLTQTVNAGEYESIGNFVTGYGWKVEVALAVAPTDNNPQILALGQRSNASPVRSNQGGAF
jgi:hypothetical protein